MSATTSVLLLLLVFLAILATAVVPAGAAAWVLAVGISMLPSMLVLLAVPRQRRPRALAPVLAALAVLLGASLASLVALASLEGELPWIFGLPVPILILGAGLLLLPYPLVVLTYFWTFEVEPTGPRSRDAP